VRGRHARVIRDAITVARALDLAQRQSGLVFHKDGSHDSELWIRAYMRTRIRLNAAERLRYAAEQRAAIRPCPECGAGKHRNCDGTSWDNFMDAPDACPCVCRRITL
jgi:hypothetical protein